ncbi:hypothetical protein KPH14_004372 [Odynerus spinipes]|uniref:2'-phosphotransferase n=1 Tax=Odynerus spinipes TaxID=1348599 RepID=A0AAD9RYM0_9HYME|nr:hypothetical protein KPH14_004372 [Odynerus spinipes]
MTHNKDYFHLNQLLIKKLHGYTFEDIKQVVETNDKQRFMLCENNGIWEVKANQGHSINKIDNLSLKALNRVDFDIIHGTYYRNWEKIKSEGNEKGIIETKYFLKIHSKGGRLLSLNAT